MVMPVWIIDAHMETIFIEVFLNLNHPENIQLDSEEIRIQLRHLEIILVLWYFDMLTLLFGFISL